MLCIRYQTIQGLKQHFKYQDFSYSLQNIPSGKSPPRSSMLEKMAHKIDNQTEEEKREILKRYRHLLKTASPFLKDGDAN